MNTRIKIILIISVSTFLLVFFLCQIKIYTVQHNISPTQSQAILILGHALDEEDEPDIFLQKRLEIGLQLYKDGYAPLIIVSGKQGPTDSMAVAEAMKNWLMKNNVDESAIIVEDRASNTYENFKFSKELMPQIDRVIVVTNGFHMYRSVMIANDFYDGVSGAVAQVDGGYRRTLSLIKEPFSIAKYYFILKGK